MSTVIPITVEVVEKGAQEVRKKIGDLGKEAGAAASPINMLKGALLAVGVGVTFGVAFNTMRSFSKELATVQAVTGATGDKMKELRAEFERLGSTTQFSASEAAAGAAFLARAGFSADETLESLSDTLNLAQAGALDLASAADISSNILTGFNMTAAEMGRVTDVLAHAANNANTNVAQMGDAMKFVAPAAAGLGVSIEETAAAVGVLGDVGIQGTLAGTALRSAFAQLQQPTDKLNAVLSKVGLTSEDVNIKMHGLTPVIDRLAKAGFNVEHALAGMDRESAVAFASLVQQSESLKTLTGELQNAEGAAARTAEIMGQSLDGAAKAVMSAFEGVILTVGRLGAELVITQGLLLLAGALRLISSALEFLIPFVVNLGIAYALLNAHVILTTAYLWAKTAAVNALVIAQWLWNAAVMANPLVALGVAIVAIITLLIQFAQHIEPVRLGILYLKAVGIELGNAIAEVWASYIKPVWEGFVEWVQYAIDKLKELMSWIGELVTWFAKLTGSVSKFGEKVNETFNRLNNEYRKSQGNAASLSNAVNDNTNKMNGLGLSTKNTGSAIDSATRSTRDFTAASREAGIAGTSAFDSVAASANRAASAISSAGSAAKTINLASPVTGGGSSFGTNSGGAVGRGGGLSDMTRYMSAGGSSIYRAQDWGGFARGGGFTVGGSAGTDKNLVMFKATRGETVDVRTPSQQRDRDRERENNNGAKTTVIERLDVHVHGVRDPNDFRRTQRQMMRDLSGALMKAGA